MSKLPVKAQSRPLLPDHEAARRALAKCVRIDDVKPIRNLAIAAAAWAREAKDTTMIQRATKIRMQAERRAGELLIEMAESGERATRGEAKKSQRATFRLPDLGVSKTQSSRWQALATIPPERFDAVMAEASAGIGRAVRNAVRGEELRQRRESYRAREDGCTIDNLVALAASGKRFSVIYADPPWQYSNSGLAGAADDHYKTMATDEICALPASGIVADEAVLFMWVTNPMVPDALRVVEAWGFEYKTKFVWIKDRKLYGKLGFCNYGQHESLFVATRGAFLPTGELQSSIIDAKKSEHSRKPTEAYDLIEGMYPDLPRIELFARVRRSGWTAWGNEIERAQLGADAA